jgi:uncharacterized protein with PQ loop repeat
MVIGLPQLLRLMSQRNAAGVSAATWSLTVGSGLTWVGHNLRHDEVVAAVANGWSALTAAAILYRYYRDAESPAVATPVALALLIGAADIAAVAARPDALGWIAAGTGMVMFLPQAWAVFRASDVSGVSIGTWCVAVLASVLWASYGVLHRDAAVVAPPVLTGSLALAIVCRLAVARRIRRVRT